MRLRLRLKNTFNIVMALLLAASYSVLQTAPSQAVTTIGDLIAREGYVFTKSGSPYSVTGSLQIVGELVIEPGTSITFEQSSSLKVKGTVRIGSADSSERSRVTFKMSGPYIGAPTQVNNSDLIGSGGDLGITCSGSGIISGNTFKNMSSILGGRCYKGVLENNSFQDVYSLVNSWDCDSGVWNFTFRYNLVRNMNGFCRKALTLNVWNGYSFSMNNNEFINLNRLDVTRGWEKNEIKQNNFIGLGSIVTTDLDSGYSASLSNNYWDGLATGEDIRRKIKVVDALTNIDLKYSVKFKEISTTKFDTGAVTKLLLELENRQNEIILRTNQDFSELIRRSQVARGKLRGLAVQMAQVDALINEITSAKSKYATALSEDISETTLSSQRLSLATLEGRVRQIEMLADSVKTISCVKAKKTIKVTGVNATCPAGYKKK